jgi:hypothetical protein
MENFSLDPKQLGIALISGVAIGVLSSRYLTSEKESKPTVTPPSARNEVQINAEVKRREERKKGQKQITYIVVGAGNRGSIYATYASENPSVAKIVGVAEPRQYRLETFLKKHGSTIPPENVFTDWNDIVKRDKFADAVVVATPDAMHIGPCIALANKGYHILVEKPMAISAEDCGRITKAAQDNGIIFAVGHVMRYTPYTQKIKEL